MALYILNTLAIPIDYDRFPKLKVRLSKITIAEAKEIISNEKEVISAVGHQATAEILSEILGTKIEFNRIQIFLKPGDKAIHFYLKQRLEEGKILSKEEMQPPYSLVLLKLKITELCLAHKKKPRPPYSLVLLKQMKHIVVCRGFGTNEPPYSLVLLKLEIKVVPILFYVHH